MRYLLNKLRSVARNDHHLLLLLLLPLLLLLLLPLQLGPEEVNQAHMRGKNQRRTRYIGLQSASGKHGPY